jgi:hypothetical protein
MPTIVPSYATSTTIWNSPPTMTYYTTPAGFQVTQVTDDVYSRQYRSLNIGHCLWAILFGLVGGWFSVWLYMTKEARGKVTPAGGVGQGS